MNARDNIPSVFWEAAQRSAAPELRQGDKVCMFLTYGGSMLFVVRFHPKDSNVSIEPAGGKIDPKSDGTCETVGEALVREGREEYGVVVRPGTMLGIENHPFTKKPVGYFSCNVLEGVPHNAADKEHLGIIGVPLNAAMSFRSLEEMAVRMAEDVVRETIPQTRLSRPIEFRVPENLVMNFIQQIQDEPGAAFFTREPSLP